MKYFLIAFCIILFVILSVWQNIEVMKLKLENEKARKTEMELVIQSDRLRYEIERFRRMDILERYASSHGMRRIAPGDFEVLEDRVKRK